MPATPHAGSGAWAAWPARCGSSGARPVPTLGAGPIAIGEDWITGMEREVRSLMQSGHPEVWDTLARRFEARMILAALEVTRGRRIEAAQRLGIGRNTITRKIQELGLGD